MKLEIPSAVAKCYIYNYKDKSYPENSSRTPNADDQINFTASVETTAISNGSVTYNIALDYSVKPNYATKYQGPFSIPLISGTQVDVSAPIPAVTITLKIDTGLKNTKVVRGAYEMPSSDDLTGVDEGYNYDSESGQLKINTKTLDGNFEVLYKR